MSKKSSGFRKNEWPISEFRHSTILILRSFDHLFGWRKIHRATHRGTDEWGIDECWGLMRLSWREMSLLGKGELDQWAGE